MNILYYRAVGGVTTPRYCLFIEFRHSDFRVRPMVRHVADCAAASSSSGSPHVIKVERLSWLRQPVVSQSAALDRHVGLLQLPEPALCHPAGHLHVRLPARSLARPARRAQERVPRSVLEVRAYRRKAQPSYQHIMHCNGIQHHILGIINDQSANPSQGAMQAL
ncbi:hypothetical protein PBRA_000346 [Plasmodiophora brassicae]|uniref:Uncharacterized protein n=1 Tax=Plasmodiophora brassicae TaxID=37360 RepID=A0A0G4IH93_PLABS|nr:hypothetical protein PBRA_000346 [Plasmodiophora brassicae]